MSKGTRCLLCGHSPGRRSPIASPCAANCVCHLGGVPTVGSRATPADVAEAPALDTPPSGLVIPTGSLGPIAEQLTRPLRIRRRRP